VHLSRDVETATKVGERRGGAGGLQGGAGRKDRDGGEFYLSPHGGGGAATLPTQTTTSAGVFALPPLLPIPQVSRSLTGDGVLLFLTRGVRMFAYGFLSVVLVLYLRAMGLTEGQIGLLLTVTLLGDTVISLWITTAADRIGRKRMLILGALL